MNPPAPKRILNIALLACLIGTSPLATTQLASAGINPDGTYTVESGDYLYRISRVTGTPINALLALNGLTLKSTIHPGQVLKISTVSATTTMPTPSTPAHVARYLFPVVGGGSWTAMTHANYRATDIFTWPSCGATVQSVHSGLVDEVNYNAYVATTDDPALRGGNAVSVIGDDGVRYYYAHLASFAPGLAPGVRVVAGAPLGTVGKTGRAGTCHLHFGLSLDCPNDSEWWVRRGVIWPDRYLTAWRKGTNRSPRAELDQWFAHYPNACRSLADTPYRRG